MSPMLRHHDIARRVLRFAVVALLAGGVTSGTASSDLAAASSRPTSRTLIVSAARTASFGTILVSGTTVYTLKAGATPCTA